MKSRENELLRISWCVTYSFQVNVGASDYMYVLHTIQSGLLLAYDLISFTLHFENLILLIVHRSHSWQFPTLSTFLKISFYYLWAFL